MVQTYHGVFMYVGAVYMYLIDRVRRAFIGKQNNPSARNIAKGAANKKTAQIAEIKQLVEKAVMYAEDAEPVHNKFDYFCYYKVDVKYEGAVFPLYLNVGRAINTGKYHLYDITKKIRDTADRINGLERPKPNEGYALQSGVSNTNVAQNSSGVNTQSMSEGAGIYSHGEISPNKSLTSPFCT